MADLKDGLLEKFPHVPERLSGLIDLAYNLWWSWHPEARVLFKQINQQAWKQSIHNPVKMLQEIPAEFLEGVLEKPEYLRRYDIIMNRFSRYMANHKGWFSSQYTGRPLTIAYFSAEYGLHHSLPFYAGGLGFLAGDHLKECSDLGIPLVGVGFMYSEGYLHQHILPDGWQDNITEMLDRDATPITRVLDASGNQMIIHVPFITPEIFAAVWRVQVGKIPLYLLDTDIPRNIPENRTISHRLYAEQTEQRLKQEIVLGIGGRKMLGELGISFSAVHLNEGHPAFAQLEGIRERVSSGMNFTTALDQVRGTAVFTTHTPVAAGNDIFPRDLIDKYFASYYPQLGIDRDTFFELGHHPCDEGTGFNMTAFALKLTQYHNGVSKKHGDIARGMWRCLWPNLKVEEVPIDNITNGVHIPTWLNPRMDTLYSKYFDCIDPHWHMNHDNPDIWQVIDEVPDKELWTLHIWLKQKLFNRIREKKRIKWEKELNQPANLVAEGMMLNPSVLTIGFARRFSSYKRADLIFQDQARLRRILNDPWRPVQIIFAGKAHPADNEGKIILKRIYEFAGKPEFGGRIGFVEDYGEQMAQYLVHGVDVWMNNPVPPMEACGTSGMKASLNGVLNLSVLDGWWIEGYNGKNGWAFEGDPNPATRDASDAAALYNILEKEVVPLYYSSSIDGIPHGWVKMMKETVKSTAATFSARRMVKEYVTKYYPSLVACAENECKIE
ncbi:MAG: alpha-glucan family phosphorylase [Methanoregula sp.]|uniref:alpha-glucan family phosphorylase n=1 Tax=Methanoregula sp. TaxID=2052170 RepID=UPI003BB108C8